MFVAFKLKNVLKLLIILAITAVAVLLFSWLAEPTEAATSGIAQPYTLVVDAGHGGIDGGATAADGTKESDINLDIALRMNELADFCGVRCVMTRDSDSDELGGVPYSERQSLLERASIANDEDNALLISVHQNTFPNGMPSGAEVMYAKTPGSERLGNIAQDNMVSMLDPSNRRVARPAPAELLLTGSVKCPAILVECGFMSNGTELSKLCSPEYRTSIALALVGSFLQFSDTETLT